MAATLSIYGINTTGWVAGQSGLWMGLGYGAQSMYNTDFNMLIYNYNNQPTDGFIGLDGCFDGGGNLMP